MPDVYTNKIVYPANAVEGDPGQEGPGSRKVERLLTFRSTGTTGLTGQVVMRPQDWRIIGQAGVMPLCTRLAIEEAVWGVNSKIDYVRFYWDRTPNEDAFICPSGSGKRCFGDKGLVDNSDGLIDGTGNLLMDVVGAADKGAFSIGLRIRLGE